MFRSEIGVQNKVYVPKLFYCIDVVRIYFSISINYLWHFV